MDIKKPNTKSTISKESRLDNEIYNTLNEQIWVEFNSSNIYLQMYSWCDVNGYVGGSAFFKKHAEEERNHMLKMYAFILDRNKLAITPALEMPAKEYIDLYDVVETAKEHEFTVTESYQKLSELALAKGDHLVYDLAQWYLHEQVEEESIFLTLCDRYNILSKGGMTGLAWIEFDEMLEELAE